MNQPTAPGTYSSYATSGQPPHTLDGTLPRSGHARLPPVPKSEPLGHSYYDEEIIYEQGPQQTGPIEPPVGVTPQKPYGGQKGKAPLPDAATSTVADAAQGALNAATSSWYQVRGSNVPLALVCGGTMAAVTYYFNPLVVVPTATQFFNRMLCSSVAGGTTATAVWFAPNLPKSLVGSSIAALMGAALTLTVAPGVAGGYVALFTVASAAVGFELAKHVGGLKDLYFYVSLGLATIGSMYVVASYAGIELNYK